MAADLDDLAAFVAVARRRGFRDAARIAGTSPSRLSEAVRRLEARTGTRLLNRTTRSVTPTENVADPLLNVVNSNVDTLKVEQLVIGDYNEYFGAARRALSYTKWFGLRLSAILASQRWGKSMES